MSTPKIIQPTQSTPAVLSDGESESSAALDEAIQGALGRKLRESYEEVVNEKVPDKFMQLLSDLKDSESAKSKKVHES